MSENLSKNSDSTSDNEKNKKNQELSCLVINTASSCNNNSNDNSPATSYEYYVKKTDEMKLYPKKVAKNRALMTNFLIFLRGQLGKSYCSKPGKVIEVKKMKPPCPKN